MCPLDNPLLAMVANRPDGGPGIAPVPPVADAGAKGGAVSGQPLQVAVARLATAVGTRLGGCLAGTRPVRRLRAGPSRRAPR